jgi:hypothetical protein
MLVGPSLLFRVQWTARGRPRAGIEAARAPGLEAKSKRPPSAVASESRGSIFAAQTDYFSLVVANAVALSRPSVLIVIT